MQNFVPQNYFPTVLDVAIKADFSRQTDRRRLGTNESRRNQNSNSKNNIIITHMALNTMFLVCRRKLNISSSSRIRKFVSEYSTRCRDFNFYLIHFTTRHFQHKLPLLLFFFFADL